MKLPVMFRLFMSAVIASVAPSSLAQVTTINGNELDALARETGRPADGIGEAVGDQPKDSLRAGTHGDASPSNVSNPIAHGSNGMHSQGYDFIFALKK